MKRCSKCKKELPATTEFFYSLKHGLRSRCKECIKKSAKQHYQINREDILAYQKEYSNKEKQKEYQKKWNQEHLVYSNWKDMIRRCYNSESEDYRYYGARGIKVCDEWKNNYEVFEKWALENGYQKGLTIDKIDNDGDYKPDNCQWLTRIENAKKAILDGGL